MICPSCGVNSATNDVCSSCRRPMRMGIPPLPGAQPTVAMPPTPNYPPAQPQRTVGVGQPIPASYNAPQQTMAMPQQPAVQQRVSLTGEVIEVTVPPPMAQPMLNPAYATPGPLPTAAYSKEMAQHDMADDGPSPGECWEKFLAIGLPIIALAMWTVHSFPSWFMGIAVACLFLLSMALSATRAIPSYDDAVADCTLALAVCFMGGPLLALIVVVVVGLSKQEPNGAVISLLGLVFVLRIAFGAALFATPDIGAMLLFNNLLGAILHLWDFVGLFAVCVCFAGWFFGNLFRPINELS